MAVSSKAAAQRLCERSKWRLTNLELQKILYIAHMNHMGIIGKPLIDGYFEAWDYGPVVPEVYHTVKMFGAEPIGDFVFPPTKIEDLSSEAKALDKTYGILAGASPGKLVAITHREGGAWEKHYNPKEHGIIIPNKDIAREFKDRIYRQRRKKTRNTLNDRK